MKNKYFMEEKEKNMKKAFDIILINNDTASREFITANDRADAMRSMEGKGEVVRIEDVTIVTEDGTIDITKSPKNLIVV